MDEYRLRHDPLLRRTYQCADCVLGIGSYVQDQLGSMKINRFEAMADTGLQNIPEAIDRTGRGSQVRCLYVGRLVRTKGIQEAIRSMAVTADYEGLPLTLDVVGEGPERPICEELIAKHHLEHRVKLQGWKSKHEVAKFYREADIFIFPSYREQGGNVVSEAMSYSLPLIIIDRGGPSSATSDECAIRIPVSSPEQVAYDIGNAIRRLVDNPDLRHRMGASAYAHAQQTALWSSKVDAIDAIYERTISDHVSNTAPFVSALNHRYCHGEVTAAALISPSYVSASPYR
ncbi:glycosyltransferase [Mesorhizobium koreense]|jgi:hypothetical protein|uniref:glycosyltransferase n=1 Tax=Mesorhizobium koreense TaxID=3074855 RepID=UPI00287B5C1D|nr:glycosyltransferase [Mesorhizobium sp. WR6]